MGTCSNLADSEKAVDPLPVRGSIAALHAPLEAFAPPGPRDYPPIPMKKQGHPTVHETTITCTCGTVYNTISTVQNLRIGICAACHPFFTGEQRFVDTAGRVDKFAQRYGTSVARRAAPKLSAASA